MILSVVKIMPYPDKWKEVIDTLLSMKGPTRVSCGCLDCTVAMEHDDLSRIVYIEQWRSWEDLHCHIRSKIYVRLLEALELSLETPEVSFFEISVEKGMEVIEAERDPDSAQDFVH